MSNSDNFFAGGTPEEGIGEILPPETIQDLQQQILQLYVETMVRNGINPVTGELNNEEEKTEVSEQPTLTIDSFLNAWGNSLLERDLDNKGKW